MYLYLGHKQAKQVILTLVNEDKKALKKQIKIKNKGIYEHTDTIVMRGSIYFLFPFDLHMKQAF